MQARQHGSQFLTKGTRQSAIEASHEKYGVLTQKITIQPNQTKTLEFVFKTLRHKHRAVDSPRCWGAALPGSLAEESHGMGASVLFLVAVETVEGGNSPEEAVCFIVDSGGEEQGVGRSGGRVVPECEGP